MKLVSDELQERVLKFLGDLPLLEDNDLIQDRDYLFVEFSRKRKKKIVVDTVIEV